MPNNESTPDSCAQLLSLAVHELRTPVSIVGGYLRMLQRDTEGSFGDRQRKMVDEAEKSCARLVALISQMSDVAKLDAGMMTLASERVDLFPLTDDVANTVHEAEEREVRLQLRGEASGAWIDGDSARLRAAFEAIFRAILREQPSACTVVVERRVERRDSPTTSAVIVVAEDTCVQQAYESSRLPFDEKRGGLGLLLPIARRVIERHGGRLTAPDDERHKSAAIVTFPLAE